MTASAIPPAAAEPRAPCGFHSIPADSSCSTAVDHGTVRRTRRVHFRFNTDLADRHLSTGRRIALIMFSVGWRPTRVLSCPYAVDTACGSDHRGSGDRGHRGRQDASLFHRGSRMFQTLFQGRFQNSGRFSGASSAEAGECSSLSHFHRCHTADEQQQHLFVRPPTSPFTLFSFFSTPSSLLPCSFVPAAACRSFCTCRDQSSRAVLLLPLCCCCYCCCSPPASELVWIAVTASAIPPAAAEPRAPCGFHSIPADSSCSTAVDHGTVRRTRRVHFRFNTDLADRHLSTGRRIALIMFSVGWRPTRVLSCPYAVDTACGSDHRGSGDRGHRGRQDASLFHRGSRMFQTLFQGRFQNSGRFSGASSAEAGECSSLSHFHRCHTADEQQQHLFVRQLAVYTLSPLSVPACPVGRCPPLLLLPLLPPPLAPPVRSLIQPVFLFYLSLVSSPPPWQNCLRQQLPHPMREGLQADDSPAALSFGRACSKGVSTRWR